MNGPGFVGRSITSVGPMVWTLVFVLGACSAGGGNQGSGQLGPADSQAGSDDASDEDELDDALGGGGGGGLLVFDGEEIPIENVVCQIIGDSIDVGTVSDTGHRVLFGTSGSNPISAQILDPSFMQWFPENTPGDVVQRDGETFTSDTNTYFNNVDDQTIEASFTVECP